MVEGGARLAVACALTAAEGGGVLCVVGEGGGGSGVAGSGGESAWQWHVTGPASHSMFGHSMSVSECFHHSKGLCGMCGRTRTGGEYSSNTLQ